MRKKLQNWLKSLWLGWLTISITQDHVSRLWLLGSLSRASMKIFLGALYEFAHAFIWSVLPFLLGGLVLFFTRPHVAEMESYWSAVTSTFKNGELLVYTISMLAPLLWLCLHDPTDGGPFPHKLPMSTICVLLIIFCAALFALVKAGIVTEPGLLFHLSVVFTLIAIALRYVGMVYHRVRLPEPTEKQLRQPQEDFLEQYAAHVSEGANG